MKKLVSIISVFTLFFLSQNSFSQDISEVKCKSQGGTGKLKGKPKKVFVNNFVVHYQFYNKKQKSSSGGFANGVLKGSSKAEMFVGLDNLTEKDFQEVTNRIFDNFKQDFKNKGYEIIDANTLSGVKALEGREKMQYSAAMYDQYPGVMSVSPSNHTFYSYTESVFKPNYASNLSKDLDNAVVANVELFVFFVEDENSWAKKNTKSEIKVDTQLRLVSYDHVRAVNEEKVSKLRALTLGKKKDEVMFAQCKVELICGRAPIGGSAEVAFIGTLKDDVQVNGAYEAEKVSSYAKSHEDNLGIETAIGRTYSTIDTKASTALVIDVDVEKYKKGVAMASNAFIDCQISEFLK